MKVKKNKYYAVVTGDIIKSSRLTELKGKRLYSLITKCYSELQKEFKEILPLNISVFRGDSWQFLITEPSLSLRVGLHFRTLLKTKYDNISVDTRMSIAVGKIEYIPSDNVSVGRGEAYKASGEGLDKLYRRNMSFRCKEIKDESTLDLITQFIDTLANKWTFKQSLAILGALKGMQQKEIAKLWNKEKISQQSIGGHLEKAGYNSIEKGLRFFEESMSKAETGS